MTKKRGTPQPRLIGQRRERRGTGLLKRMDAKVQAQAERYGVSPSWVIATILAQYFEIAEQPDYKEVKR